MDGEKPAGFDVDMIAPKKLVGLCYDPTGKESVRKDIGSLDVFAATRMMGGKLLAFSLSRDPATRESVISATEISEDFTLGPSVELAREPAVYWRVTYPKTPTSPGREEIRADLGWTHTDARFIAAGPRGTYVVLDHAPAMAAPLGGTSDLRRILPDGQLGEQVRLSAPTPMTHVSSVGVDQDGMPFAIMAVPWEDALAASSRPRSVVLFIRLTEDLRYRDAEILDLPVPGTARALSEPDGLYVFTEQPPASFARFARR